MKIKTMTLRYPMSNMDRNFSPTEDNTEDHNVYQVVKVTDSVEFAPGKQLLKRQVVALCDDAGWKITIVSSMER